MAGASRPCKDLFQSTWLSLQVWATVKRMAQMVWVATPGHSPARAFGGRPALMRTLGLGLLAASLAALPAWAQEGAAAQGAGAVASAAAAAATPSASDQRVSPVNFGQETASADMHHVANWVLHSHDNQGMPFLIVDKARAQVFVFHADGRLRGVSTALLGLAIGDDSVPGIGERKLASILPQERTTPAGRFVANLDRNLGGKEILWVDYESAVSLHPVVTNNAKERRAERLATSSPLDNRISYGCINVPADFFKRVVSAAFKGSNGIVYVLPETRTPQQVFASFDVGGATQPPSNLGQPTQVAAQAGAN